MSSVPPDPPDPPATAVDRPAGTDRYFWGIPRVTWLFLGYFLLIFIIGLVALNSLASDVSAASILALAGTVFGAVSTHLAHTAGHLLARER